MGVEENLSTIADAYEAFGRGDVGAILGLLTDDVDWAADTESDAAPWYGVRHGKDEVASFFEAFGSSMDVDEFTPQAIAGSDDHVLALVRCRARSRDTGKSIDMNLHHYFRFDDGRISFYRGTEDVVQTIAALE